MPPPPPPKKKSSIKRQVASRKPSTWQAEAAFTALHFLFFFWFSPLFSFSLAPPTSEDLFSFHKGLIVFVFQTILMQSFFLSFSERGVLHLFFVILFLMFGFGFLVFRSIPFHRRSFFFFLYVLVSRFFFQ